MLPLVTNGRLDPGGETKPRDTRRRPNVVLSVVSLYNIEHVSVRRVRY